MDVLEFSREEQQPKKPKRNHLHVFQIGVLPTSVALSCVFVFIGVFFLRSTHMCAFFLLLGLTIDVSMDQT